MTKKKQKWEWEIRQKKSFKMLKKRFTTEPILVASNLNKRMRIKIDVSDYVIREVLFMECKDKK